MAANPPIESIPKQRSSPTSHINRFLTSIRPHIAEHAQSGVQLFQQGFEAGDFRSASSPKSSQQEGQGIIHGRVVESDGQGNDWVATRQETLKRLGPGARDDRHHLNNAGRHSTDSGKKISKVLDKDPLATEKRKRDQTNHVIHQDADRIEKQKEENKRLKTEDIQRRLERKLRRREKAAIVKPKAMTPVPAKSNTNSRKTTRAASIDCTSVDSEGSHVSEKARKKSKNRLMPHFVKEYQAKNVQPGGRITSKLGRKQGFLSHGKASLPIRLPSQKVRNTHTQPFSEDHFLGTYNSALPPVNEDQSDFSWKLKRASKGQYQIEKPIETERGRSPSTCRASVTLPSRDAPQKATSRTSLARSPILPPIPSHSRSSSFRKLPPPGQTNSSSWHSVADEETSSQGADGDNGKLQPSDSENRPCPTQNLIEMDLPSSTVAPSVKRPVSPDTEALDPSVLSERRARLKKNSLPASFSIPPEFGSVLRGERQVTSDAFTDDYRTPTTDFHTSLWPPYDTMPTCMAPSGALPHPPRTPSLMRHTTTQDDGYDPPITDWLTISHRDRHHMPGLPSSLHTIYNDQNTPARVSRSIDGEAWGYNHYGYQGGHQSPPQVITEPYTTGPPFLGHISSDFEHAERSQPLVPRRQQPHHAQLPFAVPMSTGFRYPEIVHTTFNNSFEPNLAPGETAPGASQANIWKQRQDEGYLSRSYLVSDTDDNALPVWRRHATAEGFENAGVVSEGDWKRLWSQNPHSR